MSTKGEKHLMEQKGQGIGDQEYTFTTIVKIVGINRYVDVPESLIDSLSGGEKAALLVMVMGTGAMKLAYMYYVVAANHIIPYPI